ncbi:DUF421 domain-containing protein [Bdellovibrio sp. HCB2-146]|uniref:DUF421 domain-containing protein n=1 Tax=Bdellovibrio sp. HCB2-146 TaxID=3394362 RepID=UPI0039BD49F4
MWELQNPWWDYILRAVVIYAAVFLLLRIFGKKQLGEMSPFDFVLLLIISECISAAITGGDNSVAAALISVTTFILMNYTLDFLAFKSRKFEEVFDGKARVLIEKGKLNDHVRRSEKLSEAEILSALREQGVKNLDRVDLAVLEPNGKISVIEK